MPYQPPDYLALARAAEAEGNAFEAEKHYKAYLQEHPDSREAAFFLRCYEAMTAGLQDIASSAGEIGEAFEPAAAEAAASGDPGVLSAMGGRVSDLAGRWLRSVDYYQEHYTSTVAEDRKRMVLLGEKRRGACMQMLRRAEDSLAAIPGAEDTVHSLRKESLRLLSEHPDALPAGDARKESTRLARLIREREPDVEIDVATVSRLGEKKLPIMAVLLGINAVLVFVNFSFIRRESMTALFLGGATAIFDVLLYFSVRRRDEGNKMMSLAFAAIYTVVQAAVLGISLVSYASGGKMNEFSLLARGAFCAVEVLIGGIAILYAFKGPFRSSWPSLLMCAVALGFVIVHFVTWSQGWEQTYRSLTRWENSMTVEERQELYDMGIMYRLSKSGEPEPIPQEESEQAANDTSSKFVFNENGRLCLYYRVEKAQTEATQTDLQTADGNVQIVLVEINEINRMNRIYFVLDLLSVLTFDLGCAVGFLYPYARKKKKAA